MTDNLPEITQADLDRATSGIWPHERDSAVDRYKDELRAKVLALPGDGPTVYPYVQGYRTAIHDVLRLLDEEPT